MLFWVSTTRKRNAREDAHAVQECKSELAHSHRAERRRILHLRSGPATGLPIPRPRNGAVPLWGQDQRKTSLHRIRSPRGSQRPPHPDRCEVLLLPGQCRSFGGLAPALRFFALGYGADSLDLLFFVSSISPKFLKNKNFGELMNLNKNASQYTGHFLFLILYSLFLD